jgi:hypothetical protein
MDKLNNLAAGGFCRKAGRRLQIKKPTFFKVGFFICKFQIPN